MVRIEPTQRERSFNIIYFCVLQKNKQMHFRRINYCEQVIFISRPAPLLSTSQALIQQYILTTRIATSLYNTIEVFAFFAFVKFLKVIKHNN